MSDYSEELLEPLTEYKRILTEVCYRVGLSLVKRQ
jgi:hypothetical protein